MIRTPPRALWGLLAALLIAAPAVAADGEDRDRRLVDTYAGMLVDDPDQEYAFRRLLEVSHAVGGLSGLIERYTQVLATDPERFSAWVVLGHLKRTAEDEAGALAAYGRAAALRPRSASPALARAALFQRLRKWDETLAAYDAAVPLIRDVAVRQDALRAAAEAAIEAAKPDRADAYFQQLVQTEPQNLFLRMQYAAILVRLSQQERALALWQDIEERARGQLKHLVIAWKEIAELQLALGQFDAAERTWRRALEETPTDHWDRRTFIDGLISVYRRQDRLGELITEFEPQAATRYELLVTVALLHEELADDAHALKLYRQALVERPSDLQVRMAALRLLERVGTPDEVVAGWVELVRATPGEPRHELHLAELHFQRGKPAEAEALMQKISARYPADPGVHQHLVDLWMRYGDPTTRRRIEAEYKTLMRLEPDEEAHIISLGEYYWTIEDRARALATWKQLLKMGAKRAEGHFLLAEVYADHDLFDDARAAYEQAIALDPAEQRYARAFALLLERLGRRNDALGVWRALLDGPAGASAATTRDARRHIITLWEETRVLDRELVRLEASFAATPPQLAAGPLLAEAYLYLRRIADAERVLERLHALAPGDIEALVGLEAVYTRQNALHKAIAVLEELARVNARAAGEYLHRAADLALSLGDEDLALRYARRVVELHAADVEAQIRVGDLYARLGHRAEAAEAWRQAMVLDPRNDAVRFKLAALYRDLGQPVREEQILAEIVRDAREPGEALRAGRRLLELAAASGRLEVAEAVLAPLVLAGRGRPVFLKLLVDLYAAQCQQARYQPGAAVDREAALLAIGERGLRPLVDALADSDVAVRSRALNVLELTHPAGAAPALARLLQESDPGAQVQAAAALGRVGSQAAVAVLARMAGSTKIQERDLAVWALGLAHSEDAGRALLERLQRAQVRERPLIAAALGRGRHPGALAALLPLAQDRFAEARQASLWALGRLADPVSVSVLARALLGSDAGDARLAAWALGRVGDAAAGDALVAGLFAGPAGPQDAVWAALGLGATGLVDDEGYIDAMYERGLARERGLVTTPRPELFVVALPAPPRAPQGPTVARLRGALERRVAAALAGPQEGPLVRLLDALRAGPQLSLIPPGRFPADAEEDAAATRALVAAQVDALLARTAGDQADAVVGGALEVLARLAHEAPGAVPIDRLASAAAGALGRGPMARLGAVRALARWGPPADPKLLAAMEALVASASLETDRAAGVELRVALAQALGRLAGDAVPPALRSLLRDPFAAVRQAAVSAVGPGDEALSAVLLELLADPAPEVALAAVGALARQRTGAAASALAELATGGVPRLRVAARAARATSAPVTLDRAPEDRR